MLRRDFGLLVRALREAVRSVGWDKATSRLGISLLLVSAVFFAANFADKAWTSYQLGQEKQQRIAAIASLTTLNQSLDQQLTYANSRAYYREEARKYGYVQPGDIELDLTTSGPSASSTSGAPTSDIAPQPSAKPGAPHESFLHRLLQAIVPGL